MKTDLDMIDYLTECTLATVEHMLCLKNRPKGEYNRQVGIAQEGIRHLQTHFRKGDFIPKLGHRTADVLIKQLSVEAWAAEKDLGNRS